MMDTPYYRIPAFPPYHRPTNPHHYLYNHPIPVQRQPQPTPVQRKVVSIPVHYIGSDESRSESTTKIQKVFRGFLVRKSVKKIAVIKREVDEIEKRILEKETVELIRRDAKEKLKINEMLMSLLFKLDSVRGVDSSVRDCRKKVIKKAIALQEMVDSIVANGNVTVGNKDDDKDGDCLYGGQEIMVDSSVVNGMVAMEDNDNDKDGDCADRGQEIKDSVLDEVVLEQDKTPEVGESIGNAVDGEEELKNCVAESEGVCDAASIPNLNEAEANDAIEKLREMEDAEIAYVGEQNVELIGGGGDEDLQRQAVEDDFVVLSMSDCIGISEASQSESQADSSANPESLIEGDEEIEKDGGDSLAKNESEAQIRMPDQEEEGNVQEKSNDEGKEEDDKRSKELLERMMADNERMMGLMADLFERNEVQTRLLSSLSQRVEQLERAYLCEKLRRKKKRNAAFLVDCLESTQDNNNNDNKKCGKKL